MPSTEEAEAEAAAAPLRWRLREQFCRDLSRDAVIAAMFGALIIASYPQIGGGRDSLELVIREFIPPLTSAQREREREWCVG